METIYDRIKKLRNDFGWSQEELAKKVGYAEKTSIAKIEAGKVDLPQSKIVAFAKALNTTTTYLLDGELEHQSTLTSKDNRDIKKDLEHLMEKLSNQEYGPAAYDGEEIPEADLELFEGQLELMLRRLKAINKEKYNPYKNKK